MPWAANTEIVRTARVSTPLIPKLTSRPVPARSARRTTADRLALALELLRDPAFDALITGRSPFSELPAVMARLHHQMRQHGYLLLFTNHYMRMNRRLSVFQRNISN